MLQSTLLRFTKNLVKLLKIYFIKLLLTKNAERFCLSAFLLIEKRIIYINKIK